MKSSNKFNFVIYIVLFAFAILGLAASFILTIEAFEIKENSNAKLICSINEVVDCASVMKLDEAELLGFPNAIMGIAGYAVIAAIAFVLVVLRQDNKFIGLTLFAGSLGAWGFSLWLMYISVFKAASLCPYCVMSFVAASGIFFTVAIYTLRENMFGLSSNISQKIKNFIDKKWYLPLIAIYFLLIVGIIMYKL